MDKCISGELARQLQAVVQDIDHIEGDIDSLTNAAVKSEQRRVSLAEQTSAGVITKTVSQYLQAKDILNTLCHVCLLICIIL